MIHPTALIHAKARLDSTVRVGPYAVIDAGGDLKRRDKDGNTARDIAEVMGRGRLAAAMPAK